MKTLDTTTVRLRETYPDDPLSLVDVVPIDTARWQAALDDAHEIARSVDRRRTVRQHGITMTAFVISGCDAPSVGYGVVVARDGASGNVHTMCDCPVGREGLICWHAARAIDELDAWPGYVPVVSSRRPVIVADEPRCPVCGGELSQSQKLQMPGGYVWFWRCACTWSAEVAA